MDDFTDKKRVSGKRDVLKHIIKLKRFLPLSRFWKAFKLFMNSKRRQILLYILSDLIGSYVVWILLGLMNGEMFDRSGEVDAIVFTAAIIISSCWVFLYAVSGLYNRPFRRSRFQELSRIFKYTLIGVLVLFFLIVLDTPVNKYDSYRIWFTTYLLLQFGVIAFLHLLITTRTNVRIRNRKLGFPTVLVGCKNQARQIYSELQYQRKSLGYQFKGYVSTNGPETCQLPEELPYLGNTSNLPEVVKELQIEEIIIALDAQESDHLESIIEYCDNCPSYIKIVPGIYDYIVGSVKSSHILGAPLIEIYPQIIRPWERIAKRMFDIGVSLVALILLIPVYLIIAILIKLDSEGPIIFKQERIGKNGVPFLIYKFRSMYIDAEKMGPALSSDRDPRITRIGLILRKLRFDELPQFWNVLKGDMSIVGPRPERQFYIEQIVKFAPHYRHLHKIRPGITSWGQVKYGYASNVEEMVERLKYDLLYIEQMSFSLDVKIILYTIIVMIEGRGK